MGHDLDDAGSFRQRISARRIDHGAFRAALLAVAPGERDAWVDRAFGIDEVSDDGPELPRGCVPYLPCSVDTVLRAVELAGIRSSDVFVDLGSGLGRAMALVHLLTGASAVGFEIQTDLVRQSRELIRDLAMPGVSVIEGDAATLVGELMIGSVFFLYCPFGGEHLARALSGLEATAFTRDIRVCTVDLPLPPCPWLVPVAESRDLVVYRGQRRS